MKLSGKYTNEYDWMRTMNTIPEEDGVYGRFRVLNDDADPAPCDSCGEKVEVLNAINREPLSGVPLDSHDYVCDGCAGVDVS